MMSSHQYIPKHLISGASIHIGIPAVALLYGIIGLIFLVLLSPAKLSAQNNQNILTMGDNYRIHPSDYTQTEVFIVKSPLDDDVLFSSCNTVNFIPLFVSEGIYVTEDGGDSWQGNDSCLGEPIMFHGGDPGIAIDKDGRFILTRLGQTPFPGLYAHYSDDNGLSWSSQIAISTDDLERATVATDVNPNSSYFGRTYAAWVKFATPFPLNLSHTDDGAETWSTPTAINSPPNRSAGGDIAVGPDGEVYVCWAGVTETSPFKEIHVGFASSANGGADWSINEKAFQMNGITGLLAAKGNIRVNGLPGIAVDTTQGERHGWIYIVSGQQDLAPAGSDPDIVLHRSSDGGLTWSAAIRVNQDELNNGKIQYFPTAHVDRFGAVNVIFYDDRFTTNDSTAVFLARSLDGGQTWKEYEISDHNSKPIPIGGLLGQGYQGDNIDLTSTQNKLWPVWMDNSTGNYQIWTVPIEFSYLNAIGDEGMMSDKPILEQNFPNPFDKSTTIAYFLPSREMISLEVFDVYGRLCERLVHAIQQPGYHEVNFEPQPGQMNKGLFYYRITTADFQLSKTMLLVN